MRKVTYYLTLSQVFFTSHERAGEPTRFREKFERAQACSRCELSGWSEGIINTDYRECASPCYDGHLKLHTIRANYDLWARRFEKIEAGKAVLSVREWVGRPYGKGSLQREIAELTREDGIGIQRLDFPHASLSDVSVDFGKARFYYPSESLAHNDGLSFQDWLGWFKGYNLSQPMAIIHFTHFRY